MRVAMAELDGTGQSAIVGFMQKNPNGGGGGDIHWNFQFVDFCEFWYVYYPYFKKLLWKNGISITSRQVVAVGVNHFYFFVLLVSYLSFFQTSA